MDKEISKLHFSFRSRSKHIAFVIIFESSAGAILYISKEATFKEHWQLNFIKMRNDEYDEDENVEDNNWDEADVSWTIVLKSRSSHCQECHCMNYIKILKIRIRQD